MNPHPFTLLFATFAVCLAASVIPIVHVETYVLVAAAAVPLPAVPLIVVAAAIGQVGGKVWLYYGGRIATRREPPPHGRWTRAIVGYVTGHRAHRLSLLTMSAFAGLPPHYLVSLLARRAGVSLAEFVCCSLAGRLARFGILASVPHLVLG